MRSVNRGTVSGRRRRTQAKPYLLAIAAFFLSTQGTVTGLAEYAELRAGLRLGVDHGLIRSVPRTYQASLFPGKDIFENRNLQQAGAFELASLPADSGALDEADLQDITGSLPAAAGRPAAQPKPERRYPIVNRANKGDRRVLRDGTRRVARMDPRTGRLVKLTLPPPSTRELALRAATEPRRAKVDVTAPAGATAPAHALAVAEPATPTDTRAEERKPAAVAAIDASAMAKARTAEKTDARTKTASLTEQRNRDLMCLAKAVYFEARGESETGQLAVAQVVLNRVDHPFYPDNICDVVFQNQERRNKCQFSFACDGRSDRPRNQASWAQAIQLAKKSMHGKRIAEVGKSTHYHATYVNPRWAKHMVKQKQIGKHIFYLMRAWS